MNEKFLTVPLDPNSRQTIETRRWFKKGIRDNAVFKEPWRKTGFACRGDRGEPAPGGDRGKAVCSEVLLTTRTVRAGCPAVPSGTSAG